MFWSFRGSLSGKRWCCKPATRQTMNLIHLRTFQNSKLFQVCIILFHDEGNCGGSAHKTTSSQSYSPFYVQYTKPFHRKNFHNMMCKVILVLNPYIIFMHIGNLIYISILNNFITELSVVRSQMMKFRF